MKKREIINHIKRTNTWKIENYNLPIVMYYWMGREVNLQEDHNVRISSSSLHEEDFLKDLTSSFPDVSVLREFPVPIYDREVWRKYWPKDDHIFFSLDFFFPFAGVVVEIDGAQHESQREYDQARDDYLLEEYGLKTLRVDEYGWYWPERSKEFLQEVCTTLEDSKLSSSFPLPKLNVFLEENWMERWRYELKAMEKLQDHFGEDRKEIRLTYREFYRITEGVINRKEIIGFNSLFKSICNQSVYLIS